MKKQLLIAAVAATMSAGVFADISIKGDAHFQYASIDNDNPGGTTTNATQQRVRLHVTGTSGDTTVKLGLRNDGRTRVSGGAQSAENARSSGSGAGNAGDATSQFNTDYLYLTTKIGALNIKAGDWWDTTGLGVARKGKADADRVEFSTKLAGWKLGFETGADSSSTVLSASGKIGDFAVTVEHNTSVSVDGADRTVVPAVMVGDTITPAVMVGDTLANGNLAATAVPAVLVTAGNVNITEGTITPAGINGFDAAHRGDYTDVSIKGKIGSVGIAAEYFAGSNDTRGDLGLGNDADAAVVHLWTKAADITWHIAWAETDAGVAGITGNGNKFSPLGVSILAGAPGVNGAGAIGNFGDTEDEVYGVRADAKIAGMGVQFAIGNLELNNGAGGDDTFWDVIVTRPLGKGSNIKFSAGEFEDNTSLAAKISVKF